MDTPFAENYAKKKFIESGKQSKLDSYSIINPYDKLIQYNTNNSANLVNGGQILDVDEYIYYVYNGPLKRIDKKGNNIELVKESGAYKLYKYNDEIYYYGYEKINDLYGIFHLNKSTFESSLVLECTTDSFVISNDIIFYTTYDEDKADTTKNGLMLNSYNMNTKELTFINDNLADARDRDNIVIYKNKIIYAISGEKNGEILMQYDIDEKNSYKLENVSTPINFNGSFTSAKMQVSNDELYAQFNGSIYKATIKEDISWEQIVPRLDDKGYIYQLCVTDNYIFFYTNFYILDSDTHYFHIFRTKLDGSEITNIYDSKEHGTDGGSTGIYAKMYIAEDKIFIFNEVKTVLDLDGNILDWDI